MREDREGDDAERVVVWRILLVVGRTEPLAGHRFGQFSRRPRMVGSGGNCGLPPSGATRGLQTCSEGLRRLNWRATLVRGNGRHVMSGETEKPVNAVEFKVGVYRVLVGDTPELQRERHRARGAAVIAAFSTDEDVKVLSWGDTEDEQPHELVELLIAVAGSPVVQSAATSVLTLIGSSLR